jgi:hypothetical protein
MLRSLFKTHNPNLNDLKMQLNEDNFKATILMDFISNFIDNEANEAKIDKIIQILQYYNIFFGGKYINEIFNGISNATIEIYISYENIVEFLINISDCNKNNDGNILLEQLSFNLNLNSKYNSIKSKSVYEINYININTNKNITIYVVNDNEIIDKIINTDIEKDKIWYDFKNNIIDISFIDNDEQSGIIRQSEFEPLTSSHVISESYSKFERMNILSDYEFEDIVIEIIKYIPIYISLKDLSIKFNLIMNLSYNIIYNYPSIWFAFLIEMKDYNTYNILSYVYNDKIMTKERPNTIINLNNLITQIFINDFLNKYEINLKLGSDDTIEFIINGDKILNPEEELNIKKLLLFYYKYNIFKFPYKYTFQKFIIENELLDIISPLKSTRSGKLLLTINEEIEKFNESYTYFDMINASLISKDELITLLLENKENILIFNPAKNNGSLISKKDLDRLVLSNYKDNWLIDCNKLRDNNRKLLLSVYVKITISTGEYYISYNNIYTLFNTNTQIYYIKDTGETLNKTFNFSHFKNNMNVEEINYKLINTCIDKTPSIKIYTLEILPTKAIIHNHQLEEDYEPFSTIKDKHMSLSSIFNKKLSLINDERKSSQLSKKIKNRY